jgi:hypothetical protein
MTHTPGPWEVSKPLHHFDYTVINPKGDAEIGDWLVAGVRWEANARLIAAAPELLEVLEDLIEGHLRWVDLGDGIRISGPSPGQWEAARAAIAKAKGQSHE